MDLEILVQNIKRLCALKGVKPTVACRESGVGTSFINNIEVRGSVPSVEQMQMLAQYLGVSTSELLGEETIGPKLDNVPRERRTLSMLSTGSSLVCLQKIFRRLIELCKQ